MVSVPILFGFEIAMQIILCGTTHIYPSHNIRFEISPDISFPSNNRRPSTAYPFVITGSHSTELSTNTYNDQIYFQGDTPNTKPDIIGVPDNWDGTPYDDSNCSPPFGKIFFMGKCYKILSQGPCSENFWIILNNSGQPECVFQHCPGQLEYKGKCVNPIEDDVCPINEILYVEFSGYASCDCQPSLIYLEKLGKCIPEHSQGTCAYGQYIENDNNGNIVCVKNPCRNDNQVINSKDNRCYKKNYIGRCNEDDGFIIHFTEHGTASCSSTATRNIFEVPTLRSCPSGSKRDHLNRCRQTFRIERRNPFYFRIPTRYTANIESGSCPSGYFKYPNTCQKPNSLFGR